MKLFAPRNDWNMSSPASNNWWNMAGTYGTSSGIRIDESTALTHTAVLAATRVISGTLAGLPCNLVEQVDARTTKSATKHPLWKLIHDEPNPEQDIKCWLESLVAFQLNWGNAYAEIQRNTLGEIVALWPIHPSRIPLKNILRNGTRPAEYDGIVAGDPGEIVYYIDNDDGSKTAIPASDMLHVPGMLSMNGITGQSIVRWGANAIGIAIATDAHAGAVFKNGCVTNIALKSAKTVGVDTAERLRRQWQSTFSGLQNHYKTLILEEGIEPVPINMDPESTQLIDSRKFSRTDIASLYGVPPHMIGDLSNATFSNIESQGLSFVVYTMMYWIVGWEKAMQRQLLTSSEKQKYRIKFNVNGLLRGDSASRAQLYQTLFNLGAFSPNDIRELEDYNPINGGDQYFVQGNNCVPLDKICEIAQANIDKLKAPPPTPPAPVQQQPQMQPDQEDDVDNSVKFDEMRKEMLERLTQHETSLPEQVASRLRTVIQEELPLALSDTEAALARDISQCFVETVAESQNAIIHHGAGRFDVLETLSAELMSNCNKRFDVINGSVSRLEESVPAVTADKIEIKLHATTPLSELSRAKIALQMCEEAVRAGVRREITNLMLYESRALKRAAADPSKFAVWKTRFYSEFRKVFVKDLYEASIAANAIGIEIDCESVAEDYISESLRFIEPLFDLPLDKFERGVESETSRWVSRPKQLAESLFNKGSAV